MVFSLLGTIKIGDSSWTGPTAIKEGRKATLVEHKVARGKPPVQDMGDELDTKTLDFFFDETFCDPATEVLKLQAAHALRSPLPLVAGDGSFFGVRWVIESFDVQTLKATQRGRPVRMKVSASLKEVPSPSPLTFFSQAAKAAASGLTGAGVNVSVVVR